MGNLTLVGHLNGILLTAPPTSRLEGSALTAITGYLILALLCRYKKVQTNRRAQRTPLCVLDRKEKQCQNDFVETECSRRR